MDVPITTDLAGNFPLATAAGVNPSDLPFPLRQRARGIRSRFRRFILSHTLTFRRIFSFLSLVGLIIIYVLSIPDTLKAVNEKAFCEFNLMGEISILTFSLLTLDSAHRIYSNWFLAEAYQMPFWRFCLLLMIYPVMTSMVMDVPLQACDKRLIKSMKYQYYYMTSVLFIGVIGMLYICFCDPYMLNPAMAPPLSFDQEDIDRLPKKSIVQIKEEDHTASTTCAICLEEFQVQQMLIQLPCFHAFHKECCESWLLRNAQCPLCRFQLFDEEGNLHLQPIRRHVATVQGNDQNNDVIDLNLPNADIAPHQDVTFPDNSRNNTSNFTDVNNFHSQDKNYEDYNHGKSKKDNKPRYEENITDEESEVGIVIPSKQKIHTKKYDY